MIEVGQIYFMKDSNVYPYLKVVEIKDVMIIFIQSNNPHDVFSRETSSLYFTSFEGNIKEGNFVLYEEDEIKDINRLALVDGD